MKNFVNKYKFLLKQLVLRDFKVKYKRSFLGVMWSFVNPLLTTLVQYLVFSNIFRFNVDNYVAYLLCGVTVFNYFSDSMFQSVSSITSNGQLLTKVYIPPWIFPIAKILSCAINFSISFIPVLLVSFISGCKISLPLLMIPIMVVFLILFLIGMGLILSSLMVYFKDIQFIWSVLCTLWMYATPIFYPIDVLPIYLQKLESFNPIYQFIKFFRIVLIDGATPNLHIWIGIILSSFVSLLVGCLVYNKMKKDLVVNL